MQVVRRVMNFSIGPASLAPEVLEAISSGMHDFAETGMSILEVSHRSSVFIELKQETQSLLSQALGLSSDFCVLFTSGGASLQFAMLPMNFLRRDQIADYVLTDYWSGVAAREAERFGRVHVAGSSPRDGGLFTLPALESLEFSRGAAYVHITSCNTTSGTQWSTFPRTTSPLAVDMTGDLLSRPLDLAPFGLIYASTQKNLGTAGLTVVLIRRELLECCNRDVPRQLSYRTFAEHDSLQNTPPCFQIWVTNKVLHWILRRGGLAIMARENAAKVEAVRQALDRYPRLYTSRVDPAARSQISVVFDLPSRELEEAFLAGADERDMVGLRGNSFIGGLRASLFNAVPLAWAQALAGYIDEFGRRHA